MVWEKFKNVWFESLKNIKPIYHRQRGRDFTNDVQSSRYNQLETALGDNIFSDTPVGITAADERNCFCRIVDWEGELSLISSRDHCQRFSPSQISDMPRTGFDSAQNLSSGFVEWSCAIVITTTTRRQS